MYNLKKKKLREILTRKCCMNPSLNYTNVKTAWWKGMSDRVLAIRLWSQGLISHVTGRERSGSFARNVVMLKVDLFPLSPYVCVFYTDWEELPYKPFQGRTSVQNKKGENGQYCNPSSLLGWYTMFSCSYFRKIIFNFPVTLTSLFIITYEMLCTMEMWG